jgi:hypothetical protein
MISPVILDQKYQEAGYLVVASLGKLYPREPKLDKYLNAG